MNNETMPLYSGKCAACGKRAEDVPPNIFMAAPKSGLVNAIYLLCFPCRDKYEASDAKRQQILQAVETTIRARIQAPGRA